MAFAFNLIGETNHALAYTEWTIEEQTAVADKMTFEGWIQVYSAYLLTVDHKMEQAATTRVFDSNEHNVTNQVINISNSSLTEFYPSFS